MRSPVFAVKANLYMEDFEGEALASSPSMSKISNAMLMTSLVSPCLERLSVFFCEKGY